ncbi:hypothetical protein Tco_1323269, partial [Tanacetum coccineum]
MAATGAACQALWIKRLLSELTGWAEKRITVKVDNVSAIALVRNPFHSRMRREWVHQCGTRQRRTTKSRYSNKGSTKIEVRDYATNARSSRFRTKQRSRLRRRMVRKKGQEENPYEDYRDFPSVFCLKINHGGKFASPPMIRFKGSMVNWVDDIDSHIFSIVEVTSMMKKLGYQNLCMAYYYKKPNTDLDNGLTELAIDRDACEMLMYVDKFKVIELYTHHSVNKKHVLIQEPLGTANKPNEPDIGSGSEAEVDVSEDECEDIDYFVDEENLIDDVDVDMAEFKSHTDPDVEWVGCKEKVVEENEVFDLEEVDHEDFDSGSDSDEDVRRKALRKVVTRVSVEQRRQLWLKKNDKLKVRVVCRGQVPDFANNNMGTIVPVTCNPKGPTSKVQPKSISKKEKVTKPKESYGCPWAMQVSKLPNEDTWEEINPNTTVKIEVELPEVRDSEERKFKRIYICLGPLKDGFKAAGEIFDWYLPLAIRYVVESESKDSWKWFQTRIITKCTATFLSREVEESIKPNPKIPLSALKDQLQKKFEVGVSKRKELLWKCAMATTIQKFDKRMEEMKNHNIESYEWLRKIPPQHWP